MKAAELGTENRPLGEGITSRRSSEEFGRQTGTSNLFEALVHRQKPFEPRLTVKFTKNKKKHTIVE